MAGFLENGQDNPGIHLHKSPFLIVMVTQAGKQAGRESGRQGSRWGCLSELGPGCHVGSVVRGLESREPVGDSQPPWGVQWPMPGN